MKKDFLLIGRGLAGSILSLQLTDRGIAHDIIDSPGLSSSSRVAAGIINPVVLKRLKLIPGASAFQEAAFNFYQNWQSRTDTTFFNPIPIAHIFQSTGEVNAWSELQGHPSFSKYLGPLIQNEVSQLIAPHGLGLMQNTAWLETLAFLDFHATTLSETESSFGMQVLTNEEIATLAKKYRHVVICTGHLLRHFPGNFQDVFTPTRGEVMIIETKELSEHHIIHGPVFILPLGNHRYKVGSTYHWNNLTDTTTVEGLSRLKEDLGKIFSGKYTVLDHQAGVRPNVKDRKPLLGKIRENIYCFNGLGSRGALMAPLLSTQLLDFILNSGALPREYDITRFSGQTG